MGGECVGEHSRCLFLPDFSSGLHSRLSPGVTISQYKLAAAHTAVRWFSKCHYPAGTGWQRWHITEGVVRLRASPPSRARETTQLLGPVALPQTHARSPLQTLLKPLLPLFPSTNSKASKRPMLLTLEWTASPVSVHKSGHAFPWQFACDVWKWLLTTAGDRLDMQPLSNICNGRAENKASF